MKDDNVGKILGGVTLMVISFRLGFEIGKTMYNRHQAKKFVEALNEIDNDTE